MTADRKQQKPTVSPATGLTPQQEQAAAMLASGDNITAVARQLEINRSTLYDWQANAAFVCYYNKQCQEHQQAIKNALFGLHQTAINTFTELLSQGRESTRLKAATWLLERAMNVEVGDTDIRNVLRKRCTHDWDDWGKFSQNDYREMLARFGLSDD